MRIITAQDVIAKLNESMESELPDMILKVLKDKEGKRFDKRVIDYLNSKIPGKNFRKRDSYLYSSISYDGNECGLTVYYNSSDHIGTIKTEYIEKHNVAYFEARKRRNAERRGFLNSSLLIQELVERHNAMVCQYEGYVSARRYKMKAFESFPECSSITDEFSDPKS